MRGATHSAQRLRQVFRSLRSALGRVTRPQATDPITQIILGIFSRDVPEPRAREALERLRAAVVDYNELRVISPRELTHLIGNYPDSRTKCEDLSRALNRIFAIEHTVSLERLTDMSRKDMVTYLGRIDGLEAYTRARVRLLGLRQHAIPLDEAMWAYARKVRMVDARCPLEEAQAFLERQVEEEDALEFVALLRKQAWQDLGSAVRKGEFERIRSVPPDRTSRNMLAQVAAQTARGEAPATARTAAAGAGSARTGPAKTVESAARKARRAAGGRGTRGAGGTSRARAAGARSATAVRNSHSRRRAALPSRRAARPA
jgi:endonuclease III